MKRDAGSGAIYQRKNGSWCGQVRETRNGSLLRRRTVYGRSRELVEAKIEAILYGIEQPQAPPPPPRPRPDVSAPYHEFLRAAKSVATHTEAQWIAKRDAIGCCIYCGTTEDLTADHVIPPSRGGDDSIGNIVPACHHCNGAKGAETGVEFLRRLMASA